MKHPLCGPGFSLYWTIDPARTRTLAHMMLSPPTCSANEGCWIKLSYYHFPELAKGNSSKCTVSFLCESDSDHYSTRTHNASQLRSCKPSLCKASSEVAVSAGQMPALTSKALGVCDISTAGSFRDCDSITVFDTCNGSHLFFLSEFWKPAFFKNEKQLLNQHLAHFAFMSFHSIPKSILYFWYIAVLIINGLCWNMLLDGWYADFLGLIK